MTSNVNVLEAAGATPLSATRVMGPYIPAAPAPTRSGWRPLPLIKELHKILGRYTGEAIEPLAAPIAATCTRVPVRDGHTEAVTLGLGREVSLDEVADAIASYRGRAQELALPSAPANPLVVRPEIDRPQPQLDRDVDSGRVVSVGRIRRHDAFANGIAFEAVGHNHDRGTVGNAVILTELVAQEGLSLRH